MRDTFLVPVLLAFGIQALGFVLIGFAPDRWPLLALAGVGAVFVGFVLAVRAAIGLGDA